MVWCGEILGLDGILPELTFHFRSIHPPGSYLSLIGPRFPIAALKHYMAPFSFDTQQPIDDSANARLKVTVALAGDASDFPESWRTAMCEDCCQTV